MLKLFIVRHGETEFNVQKRMQGRLDSPLTPRGINNAIALGEKLKTISFDRIYSSPSPRALKTAQIICGHSTVDILIEDELREMNLADWEGKSKEELEQLYPKEYDLFWNEPQIFQPDGGESFQQVQDRATAFINKLIEQNQEGEILIVTHSVVIKTLIAYYHQLPMKELWAPPYIYDTCVTLLVSENGNARFEQIADISHVI